MQTDNLIIIDLRKFKGVQSSIFTGRKEGKDARKELDLDAIDKDASKKVSIEIPEGTTSFNPSFYLGLLYESYKALGVTGFNSKYEFKIKAADNSVKKVLEKNLEDGQRNAINSLHNKTSFSFSF